MSCVWIFLRGLPRATCRESAPRLYTETRGAIDARLAGCEPSDGRNESHSPPTPRETTECRASPTSPHIFSFLKPVSKNCADPRFFRAKRGHRDATGASNAITVRALCWETLAKRANPWYFLRIFPSLTTEPSFSCGCCRKESGQLWVEGTGGCFEIRPAARGHRARERSQCRRARGQSCAPL